MDEATISLDEDFGKQSDAPPRSELPTAETDTPVGQLLNRELEGLLAEAIEKLPEEYQQVFLRRDVEGASTEETATELGLTPAAVKSRLHRARKMLREELEHYVGLDT